MGLPSGVMWAPCNIDVEQPGGFAESPFQYDCSFFSWGNVDGHNPTGPASFSPWNWGGVNAQDPWYDGQVYGDTPGNTLNGDIPVGEEFDAARANLGEPWRMPTSDDFVELFNNSIYIDANGNEIDPETTDKRVTVNGVVGIYLQSIINGARLFFSCAGYGENLVRYNRSQVGVYGSSTWYTERNARVLSFRSSGVNPQNYDGRNLGLTVRPVIKY